MHRYKQMYGSAYTYPQAGRVISVFKLYKIPGVVTVQEKCNKKNKKTSPRRQL